MFESMAAYAEKHGQKITDSMFKNVVDYSGAQRLGYIEAFVVFWTRRKDDSRTEEELRKTASSLLKGCREHFRAQINRVKKISAVVHPGLQDVFVNDALALLEVEDYVEFMEHVELLIKKFPKAEGWVRWWARECHAKMLFKPFREMHVEEWDSIPNTTNAQESQHKKIYLAIGKKHELIPGLRGLRQLAEHYALLAAAASYLNFGPVAGVKIRYGIPEPWKHAKTKDGLSKRARAANSSHSRKDGRPPDTSKELVPGARKGKGPKSSKKPPGDPRSQVVARRPSYAWRKNSCWLDTSLELVFQTVSRDFERQFGSRATYLHAAEAISKLFELMTLRRTIEDDPSSGVGPVVLQTLATQREGFRKFLKKSRIEGLAERFEFLIGWLDSMISHEQDRGHNFPRSYFQAHLILLRTCCGDQQTPNHYQLKHLSSKCCLQLQPDSFQKYRGDVAKWFRQMVLINKEPENSPSCWRTIDDDGEASCSGKATVLELVLGIPVMLILELPNPWAGHRPHQWNFPSTIRPLTLSAETMHGVVYDIVGRAFTNDGHFKAIFTADGKHVYEYDDMHNDGCATLIPNSRVSSHLAGEFPPESGWRTYAVVYRLRGGTRAQNFFTQSQVRTAERLYSIRFTPLVADDVPYKIPDIACMDLPNVVEMDPEERYWLSNPWRMDVVDFVSSRPPQSKPKRTRFSHRDSDHHGCPAVINIQKSFSPGKGALARHGKYWYPVRLLSKEPGGWMVNWWRGNRFIEPQAPPSKVSDSDLRDELWANPGARRQIRLGEWEHACETPTDEDLILEFRQAPYTNEIDKALRPYLGDLEKLLANSDGDSPSVPASVFSRAQKNAKGKCFETLRQGGVPYTGELSSSDCARVANWFYNCVPGSQNSVVNWLMRVPGAHACTILIAYRNLEEIMAEIQINPRYDNMDQQTAIFKIAWQRQTSRSRFQFVDVDHECLNIFEERLFEDSCAAGCAGNRQWGLDVGPHQNGWNPYANIPAHWNHEDRNDESESELQVSCRHIQTMSVGDSILGTRLVRHMIIRAPRRRTLTWPMLTTVRGAPLEYHARLRKLFILSIDVCSTRNPILL
ncbi:hypothetical protein B0H11DRAFT_1709555 [Mycena galericulata]|nr:hypothetical protein B0H11DRAFT_1709555 [Mycena galericulata]